jgi:hypothetical protein
MSQEDKYDLTQTETIEDKEEKVRDAVLAAFDEDRKSHFNLALAEFKYKLFTTELTTELTTEDSKNSEVTGFLAVVQEFLDIQTQFSKGLVGDDLAAYKQKARALFSSFLDNVYAPNEKNQEAYTTAVQNFAAQAVVQGAAEDASADAQESKDSKRFWKWVYGATAVILYVVAAALALVAAGVVAVGVGTGGLGLPIAIPASWLAGAAAISVASAATGFAVAAGWKNSSEKAIDPHAAGESVKQSIDVVAQTGTQRMKTMFSPKPLVDSAEMQDSKTTPKPFSSDDL